MPAKKPEPIIPGPAADVAALRDLLEYAREHHWTLAGGVQVGGIVIGSIVDDHPRKQLERRNAAKAAAEVDDMDQFPE